MIKNFMFTSESVTAGHPDKLCDMISDAVVDKFIRQDPYARVFAECAVSSAILFVAARFASGVHVDVPKLARDMIREAGYDQPDFNPETCSILSSLKSLPEEACAHFDEFHLTDEEIERIPVKNQVTVFGFACDQTPQLMPLPVTLAHKLSRQLDRVRRQRMLSYLIPDGKVQVGVEYKNRRPVRIHSVVVTATQKSLTDPSLDRLRKDIREAVVEPVFTDESIRPDSKTNIKVNPDGLYTGGPASHSGLTGRKNAIDTYGEYSRHSGKALSGKDPLRIDRTGAYAARFAAKNVVAAKLATECEITLSYSIGQSSPVSIQAQTFGTGRISDTDITDLVRKRFDFRLAAILRDFRLRYLPGEHPEGFYRKLSAYGHFGRSDMDLPWENTELVSIQK